MSPWPSTICQIRFPAYPDSSACPSSETSKLPSTPTEASSGFYRNTNSKRSHIFRQGIFLNLPRETNPLYLSVIPASRERKPRFVAFHFRMDPRLPTSGEDGFGFVHLVTAVGRKTDVSRMNDCRLTAEFSLRHAPLIPAHQSWGSKNQISQNRTRPLSIFDSGKPWR